MSDILTAHGIVKTYREGDRPLVVLDGLNLAVRDGEVLAITGPSGVGKSTLLHILGLLDVASRGRLHYRDRDLADLSGRARARMRNSDFGFVFQFYHLLPDLTALENVLLPQMVQSGWASWFARRNAARERAFGLLDDVDLLPRAAHRPATLSGGEKQRVAIARALVNEPRIVFCDEPTGNLDEKTSDHIHDLLWKINQRTGTTFVIVTHDQQLAARCHRIARMHEGRVSEVVANE
jgi:lipoprotein-releasing system ATP-binding protein